MIASDVILYSGFGLVSPILAIFIKENLVGGTIAAAGAASAIFLITRSILQILFAYIFNPKDRRWMLLLGTFLISITPFLYILLTEIWHIYVVQFIYGIGASLAYPAWYSIFTSNLSKGQRGYQWSIYSSGVGIGAAITAFLGALLAEKTSFNTVFFIAGVLGMIGLVILCFVTNKEIMKKI